MQEDAGVEAKEGEQASQVVTRPWHSVWALYRVLDVVRRGQPLSPSNGQSSLRAPGLLEGAIRFIHLVTHTRPDQLGGLSPRKK